MNISTTDGLLVVAADEEEDGEMDEDDVEVAMDGTTAVCSDGLL